MKIYGYARLNKKRKLPQKLGINKQEAMIREYAQAHKLEITQIFSDVEDTSVSLELPNLKKLIHLCEQQEIDMLIVARLDRVTRSVRAMCQFLQKVCKANQTTFISITEGLDSSTASGRLAIQTIHLMAKWDAKMISDRTKELVERKRSIGEKVGHAPFGFVYQKKKLIPFLKELKIAYLIREKREAEGLSYHKIAKFLNESQIPSKRGGRWYAETIKTIYENPLYDDHSLKKLATSQG